jgi:hypothetical protein
MNNNGTRKGIWIPNELMEISELDWVDMVLLTEIIQLAKLPDGCIASNEHFAQLLRMNKSAASRRITKLKKLGYLTCKNVYKNKLCLGRKISPTGKYSSPDPPVELQKQSKDHEGVVPDRSTDSSETTMGVVPEITTGSSNMNNTVVPDEQGGSSETTRGVVPGGTRGSSRGNTNNSINTTSKKNANKKTATSIILGEKTFSISKQVEGFTSISSSGSVCEPDFKESIITYEPSESESNVASSVPEMTDEDMIRNMSISKLISNLNYIFEPDNWYSMLRKKGIDKFIEDVAPLFESQEPEVRNFTEFLIREFYRRDNFN